MARAKENDADSSTTATHFPPFFSENFVKGCDWSEITGYELPHFHFYSDWLGAGTVLEGASVWIFL
jgi:hypothetical protein